MGKNVRHDFFFFFFGFAFLFSGSVSLLKNLPEDKLTKIMDCLEVVRYC